MARWAGVKTKEVKARLGDIPDLPNLCEAKAVIAEEMTPVVERYIRETKIALKRGTATLAIKAAQLKDRHRAEREALKDAQARCWETETQARATRFRSGLPGLWDRFTGKHKHIQRRNEAEANETLARNGLEREALINRQLEQRRALQTDVKAMRQRQHDRLTQLREDVATYAGWVGREKGLSPIAAPEESRLRGSIPPRSKEHRPSRDFDHSR